MTKTPLIWQLHDTAPGHKNQVIGVANALNIKSKIIQLDYNSLAKLPNILNKRSLLSINNQQDIKPPWPDLVISAGRKTVPIALYIKHKSPQTKLVHIMWPGKSHQKFDIIALPEHDKKYHSKNIIHTIGAPNHITPNLLKNTKLSKNYTNKPYATVLIGGTTKKGTLTDKLTLELTEKINKLLEGSKYYLLISTSRRTPQSAIKILEQNLKIPYYLYSPDQNIKNPYLDFLKSGDFIITTGDSISMCSEACSSQKPVYIFAPESLLPKKHQLFIKNLYQHKHAKPLDKKLESWQPIILNDAKKIADAIKLKLPTSQ